jgi:hypothetical protein
MTSAIRAAAAATDASFSVFSHAWYAPQATESLTPPAEYVLVRRGLGRHDAGKVHIHRFSSAKA